MATKFKGIIYLHRDGFDYASTDKPEVKHLSFSSDLVLDLEIINVDNLKTAIQSFIGAEKIPPAHALIILGDSVIFSKTLVGKTPEEQNTESKEYLKNVPFEHVVSKIYKTQKETKIIATNKDFYTAIKSAFESNGHTFSAVTHQIFFSKDLPSEATLTGAQAKILFGWVDSIKTTENFLDQPAPVKTESEQILLSAKPQKKKSSLPVLIPVFGILIAIMVVLYLSQQNQNKTLVTKASSQPQVLPSFTPTPTIEPTPAVSTSSASLVSEYGSISINILNGSGIAGQAEKTKQILTDVGFKNIETGNASTRTQTRTIVIFSKLLPDEVRTLIVNTLKSSYGAVSAQETQSSEYDVIVTVGSQAITPSITP